MKRLVLIFLILVLASGCNNPFSVRTSSNYFPLGEGYKWVYEVSGAEYSSTTTEVLQEDSLFKLSIFGEEVFIQRKEGVVNRVRELWSTHEGEKVEFGKIYEPYLKLPFVEDDSWGENFQLSTIHNGDTVFKNIKISVDSIEITERIVPSGEFKNSYRLKRTRIEDADTVITYEWYAPNIGMIRKEFPADTVLWELSEFSSDE